MAGLMKSLTGFRRTCNVGDHWNILDGEWRVTKFCDRWTFFPDPSDRSAGIIYKPGLVCNHKNVKNVLSREVHYISRLETRNSKFQARDLIPKTWGSIQFRASRIENRVTINLLLSGTVIILFTHKTLGSPEELIWKCSCIPHKNGIWNSWCF